MGIGSGSTVPYVVDRIVQQGVEANKGRLFFPTGESSYPDLQGLLVALLLLRYLHHIAPRRHAVPRDHELTIQASSRSS